jgi:probable F420-dependent oxidoreductase
MSSVDVGVHLPQVGPTASTRSLRELARHAEGLGFSSVWVSDHIVIPETITNNYPYGPPGAFTIESRQQFFEPLSTLAFVAAVTHRVRLGVSVLVVPLRQPVYAAKQLATIDALSDGRLIVGVGTGWLAEEFVAVGLDEQSFKLRGARSDDALALWNALWSDEVVTRYDGVHFSVPPVRAFPKPVQRPRPPIWVGGHSPAALHRASHHDGWHAIRLGTEEIARGAAELQRLCQCANTPTPTVSLRCLAGPQAMPHAETAEWHLTGDAAQARDRRDSYVAAGVRHLVLDVAARDDDDPRHALDWIASALL